MMDPRGAMILKIASVEELNQKAAPDSFGGTVDMWAGCAVETLVSETSSKDGASAVAESQVTEHVAATP